MSNKWNNDNFKYKYDTMFLNTEHNKHNIIKIIDYQRKFNKLSNKYDYSYALRDITNKKNFLMKLHELEYLVNTLTYLPIGNQFKNITPTINRHIKNGMEWFEINELIIALKFAKSKKLINKKTIDSLIPILEQQPNYVKYKKLSEYITHEIKKLIK